MERDDERERERESCRAGLTCFFSHLSSLTVRFGLKVRSNRGGPVMGDGTRKPVEGGRGVGRGVVRHRRGLFKSERRECNGNGAAPKHSPESLSRLSLRAARRPCAHHHHKVRLPHQRRGRPCPRGGDVSHSVYARRRAPACSLSPFLDNLDLHLHLAVTATTARSPTFRTAPPTTTT